MSPKVKILICYHKVSPIIANDFLAPILLGAESAPKDTQECLKSDCIKHNTDLLRDDSICAGGGQPHSLKGNPVSLEDTYLSHTDSAALPISLNPREIPHTLEHISSLNPYFCELTAMYWAWKNLEADYYGLFHYRRVLDFTSSSLLAKTLSFLTPKAFPQVKYSLHPCHIDKLLQTQKPDMIIPQRQNLAAHLTSYDTYKQDHHIQDLDKALAYIKAHFPYMQEAVQEALFTKGQGVYYWNIAIWRKELFFEYCEWLFDVLFGIMEEIPYKQYDDFQKRVFGFLAERLSNVWLMYKMQTQLLKIIECKTRLLHTSNKKFFGVVRGREYKRHYCFFIRMYKKPLSPPPPTILVKIQGVRNEYKNFSLLSQS